MTDTRRGYWLVALALLVLMLAAGAPSPLFVVYQARWGFSALALTAAFAVYALALLVALLVTGAVSDRLGRRPVLAVGLLLVAGAMGLFLTAGSLGGLVLARVLQGLGTGVAIGAVSAALVELQPVRPRGPERVLTSNVLNAVAPTLGLGLGALGSGLLTDTVGAATDVVFGVLLVGLVAATALLALVPETVARHRLDAAGLGRLLRPRVRVPRGARATFGATAPVMVATWAIGGLYLSLGPVLAARQLDLHRHVAGGLVVTTLTLAGAAAVVLSRDLPPARVLAAGATSLAVGVALTLLALDLRSVPGFFVATAVAGIGFGGAFSGALRSVVPLAAADERGELFAAVYTVSYLGFSVPAVLAGLAVPHVGLLATTTTYGSLVIALAFVALLLTWRARSTGRRAAPAAAAARTSPRGCPGSA